MKVAVSGSSGLIGSALVRSLRADGHEVVRLARPSSGADGATVAWDIEAGTIDAAGLEGVDGVVHLAGEGIGEKRWTDEQKRRIAESRTQGTALLAGALAGLASPPRTLVSGSAMGYYGDRGDEVLSEGSGPQPGDFLSDLCVAWEAATAPAEAAGIRVAHIRTGIVLARGGGALAKVLPLFKLGLGGRIGPGTQWWSWISLTDEVAAIRFLLDHDVAGAVNLTGPEPVTNDGYTKALGEVLHRPTFLPVPRFAPRLLLGTELANQLLFTSARVVPAVLEREGFAFAHRTVESALRAELGG